MNVKIISEDLINFTEKDLMLISDFENAVLNSKNRTPVHFKETKKLVNKLNKLITQKQSQL